MTRRLDGGKLVVASHNDGKVDEIRQLLAPYGIETVSAADLDLPSPEETENTFAGNARIKAHSAASRAGLPALSDDSGIEVAALDGAPGVRTADWAETMGGRDYSFAMSKVQQKLDMLKAPEPRLARFVCTLCLAWPDGHDEVWEGEARGSLTWPMRGDLGHGYDPVFVPEGHERTFGEMTREEKNALSHRSDAFAKLVAACFGDRK